MGNLVTRFLGCIDHAIGACLFATLLVLAGCATVPITGRSQVNLFSDEEMVAIANDQFSQFMGFVTQEGAVLSETESPAAAAVLQGVGRISDRIIEAAGLRDRYDWQTVVVNANQENAFVMPNGKIIVYTGILPIAKTEAGLAAVTAHEVAHVVARHGAERASQQSLAQGVLEVADAVLAGQGDQYRPWIGAALGLGAQYGVLLPFSREHESEADHIGLLYMAKAGYDPAEAIGVWERMEAASGSGRPEFLSTHPSHATRRSQIQAWLPEANVYYVDRTRALP